MSQANRVNESTRTPLTRVRLLARMSTPMLHQLLLLSHRFAADITDKWQLASVYAHVLCQIRSLLCTILAQSAHVLAHPLVYTIHMLYQVRFRGEMHLTMFASECGDFFLLGVCFERTAHFDTFHLHFVSLRRAEASSSLFSTLKLLVLQMLSLNRSPLKR